MSLKRSSVARVLFVLVGLLSVAVASAETLMVLKTGTGSGTVSSNVGPINCGVTCNATYANSTVVTLTAAAAGGSQFTGWLGSCTGTGSCQITLSTNATVSATFAPAALGPPRLDIDGTASNDALTDGLLIVRYLFGLTGPSLIAGAVGPDGARTGSSQIGSYIVEILPALDIDGNGTADALTDGLLIIRYLFGLRGNSLISNAVGNGAIRMTAPLIEAKLAAFFAPVVAEAPLFTGSFTAPSRTALATMALPSVPGRPGLALLVLPEATLYFDPAERTPTSAAAECAAVVIACFKPGERNLPGCLSNVPQCQTNTPWVGNEPMCCASTCAARYQELRAAGESGAAAFSKAVFRAPSCMPGVTGYPAMSQP